MRIELILTGNELLDGRVINTNQRYLSELVNRIGFSVSRAITVGDHRTELETVFQEVSERADIAIVTGGLGPTEDDRTSEILAKIAPCPLKRHPEAVEDISRFFQRKSISVTEIHLKQANIPQAASVLLRNPIGTAPGYILSIGQCVFITLPGVPYEMEAIAKTGLLSYLESRRRKNETRPITLTFRCFGCGEAQIAEKLAELYPLPPHIHIGYQPEYPEIILHITIRHPDSSFQKKEANRIESVLKITLGDILFSMGEESLAKVLGDRLRKKNATLAVAESCTGGLLSYLITTEPDASQIFKLGIVSYGNEVKQHILHVLPSDLGQNGAVSAGVAETMAREVRQLAGSDIGVSITGIAGPKGGSPKKPVGTVFIGLATKKGVTVSPFHFGGNRTHIQRISAYHAMRKILNTLT